MPDPVDYKTVVEIIRAEVMPQLEKMAQSLEAITRDHVTRSEFSELRRDVQQAISGFDQKYLTRELGEERYLTKKAHQEAYDALKDELSQKGWTLFLKLAAVVAFLYSLAATIVLVITHFHP